MLFMHKKCSPFPIYSGIAEGKESEALDLIVDNLVNNVYKHLAFFDFGISPRMEQLSERKSHLSERRVRRTRRMLHSYELTVASSHGSSILKSLRIKINKTLY